MKVEQFFAEEGLDLRDYFAAKALTGLASVISEASADHIAQLCYMLADALMAARLEKVAE